MNQRVAACGKYDILPVSLWLYRLGSSWLVVVGRSGVGGRFAGPRSQRPTGIGSSLPTEPMPPRILVTTWRSFDAIVCLEAAGDICVSEEDKERFVCELHRVLRPDGRVGFSDLALHTNPPPTDNRTLRAVLYHRGEELVTDWPALFLRHGFSLTEYQDIIAETMPTWQRTQAIYEERRSEVVHRYGKRIADRTRAQVHRIPTILARYATFPVLSVLK
jgi:SAM-dependent methyltransferase